jgi:hypothetical protein
MRFAEADFGLLRRVRHPALFVFAAHGAAASEGERHRSKGDLSAPGHRF